MDAAQADDNGGGVGVDKTELTAYERATIVQALRHYYDLLFRSTGPHKDVVMSDLIVLQNKVLESSNLSLPQVKPGQLDRIEAMLVAMKGGGHESV